MVKSAQEPEININLMPGDEEPRGSVGRAISWALTVGRVLVIGTEIVAIAIFALSIKLAADKQDLKENIHSLTGRVQSQIKFEDEFRTVQKRIQEVKSQRSTHFLTSSAISEFLSLLPVGMNLDSLELKEGELLFSGNFKSPRELQTLIFSFNQSNKIVGLNIINLEHPNKSNKNFKFSASAIVITTNFEEKINGANSTN